MSQAGIDALDARPQVTRPDFVHIRTRADKWTFQPEPVRRYVEGWLTGRVLNLFAGMTKLTHDGEIVRNDLDEEKDADHHFDAIAVGKHFPANSFDTVILDPPYNVRKAREKYNGEYQGKFTAVKEQVKTLVRPGGLVVHCGYQTPGMGISRGFELVEVCNIAHGGDINDTLICIEQRVESDLADYAEGDE